MYGPGNHIVSPDRMSRQGDASVCGSQVSSALAASPVHAAAHPPPLSSWLGGTRYDHPTNLAGSDAPAGDPVTSTRQSLSTSNIDTERTLSPVASQPSSVLNTPVQHVPAEIAYQYCRHPLSQPQLTQHHIHVGSGSPQSVPPVSSGRYTGLSMLNTYLQADSNPKSKADPRGAPMSLSSGDIVGSGSGLQIRRQEDHNMLERLAFGREAGHFTQGMPPTHHHA